MLRRYTTISQILHSNRPVAADLEVSIPFLYISGVVPKAGHVDLYDRADLIPFDKLITFFRDNLIGSGESVQPTGRVASGN